MRLLDLGIIVSWCVKKAGEKPLETLLIFAIIVLSSILLKDVSFSLFSSFMNYMKTSELLFFQY